MASTPKARADRDTQVSPGDLTQALDAEIALLEQRAARSTSPCLAAQVIAIADSRVRELLLAKAAAGNIFGGVTCVGTGEVLFTFSCPPGTLCLINPSFLVTVDLARQHVIDITDPYVPGSHQGGDLGAQAMRSRRSEGFLPSSSSFHEAAAAGGILEAVVVTLSGGFFHGEISVENQTIPLFNQRGSATILLMPPAVEVNVLLAASASTEYKWSLKMRGRTKTEEGLIAGGKVMLPYSYPFGDFGLPTSAGGNA